MMELRKERTESREGGGSGGRVVRRDAGRERKTGR